MNWLRSAQDKLSALMPLSYEWTYMQWCGCQKCKTDNKLSQTASLPFFTVFSASIKCVKYRTYIRNVIFRMYLKRESWNLGKHLLWKNTETFYPQRQVGCHISIHTSINLERWEMGWKIAEPPWLRHKIEKGPKKVKSCNLIILYWS